MFRYTQDKFSESHELTIGAAFVSKDVTLTGATGTSQLRLHIWDTAGEEAYRSMTRFFYREAAAGAAPPFRARRLGSPRAPRAAPPPAAGIIVYDVTSRASFQAVQSWVADFREQCPDATVIVAGNKIDCPNRAVTKEEGVSYAEKNNMRYIECSAKANTGVSELFQCVGELLVDSGDSSAQA